MSFLEDYAKTNLFKELEDLKRQIGKIRDESVQKDENVSGEVVAARDAARVEKARIEAERARLEMDEKRSAQVLSSALNEAKSAAETAKLQLEMRKLVAETEKVEAESERESELSSRRHRQELARYEQEARLDAERARFGIEMERLRNAAAEETEAEKIAAEKLRREAEHRIAALDAEYEKARRQAETEARKHDFEMSRLAAEKAQFERKSGTTPAQARAFIEQVRKDITRPDKTPLYVGCTVYALLTGGYVACAALLCRQIGNGVSAIVLLAVVTLVWSVLTLLLSRLLRSRAEVVRKQTERYDNLMNVLDERHIKLLDKEL